MEDDEGIRAARLLAAQESAEALFRAIEAEGILRPGVWDSAASEAVYELAGERFGVEQHWHKRIVRSGPNTLQPYVADPPDRQMVEGDIVFADFGPVFVGWEADFGRTWVLGDDPVKLRLRDDLAPVFAAGQAFYRTHPEITAADMYAEMIRLAGDRGWEFGNMHCGHLVGEHPHEEMAGGRLDSLICASNPRPLRGPDPSGRVGHWILEVHLVDRDLQIGGFLEQLLTLP
ncbi:MAG TPA: M24 family metallopeptidase [Acidimicrobiales bacterium]|nr:M24 family metallopeptidase [Acidimicrobiales bacterium]